jgi:hypothetical protein
MPDLKIRGKEYGKQHKIPYTSNFVLFPDFPERQLPYIGESLLLKFIARLFRRKVSIRQGTSS